MTMLQKVLTISLNVLHNYYFDSNKFIFQIYIAKFRYFNKMLHKQQVINNNKIYTIYNKVKCIYFILVHIILHTFSMCVKYLKLYCFFILLYIFTLLFLTFLSM